MGKFNGILICTDLDGTLLETGGKTVSKENIDAIRYFQAEGGFFTFITGRMPYFAGHIAEMIGPNAPFGCGNGGGLYDYDAKEYIWKYPISPAVIEMVKAVEAEMPEIGVQVNMFDKIYFTKDNPANKVFREVTHTPYITCAYEDITAPIAKILFCDHRNGQLEYLADFLHAHPLAGEFDFVRSEKTLYEILPKGIDKGSVLPRLTAHLGISMDKTVTVGDYYNDIGMLKAAKAGIAVANACDAAKEAADYVTVSNDEHAIARIIADIENGVIKV